MFADLLNKKFYLATCCLLVLFAVLSNCKIDQTTKASVTTQSLPQVVDFNFHVKPILSDRCFKCHGPDANTREAGLRFDTQEGAFAALGENNDHFAIVPGETEKSSLIDRIFTDDPDDVMPPPESNLSLQPHEKEILKRWIEQGAEWKTHWSFLPLLRPDLPKVKNESWVQNEIDLFVLNRLEQEGLAPSVQAAKEQLLRRVSFDLTGLPPTLSALTDFLNDTAPDAYEKAVDRLLSSDAYAENMTAKWLDLARYADTHGYQDDLERLMWPWRDWVIHAFKNNMPYDQFVTWQLAGDLLPNPTKEQLIATAFNRNHKITQEGGVIDEEYRVEYVSDRTQTFGTAFLGTSFECAKCHDHKYDPISQKDYYSLFAFFNNVPEKGLIPKYGDIPKPYIQLTKEEIEQNLAFINNADTLQELKLMVMREMKQPRPAFVLNRGAYDQPTDPVQPATPADIQAFPESLPKNRLGLAQWLFLEDNAIPARVLANRLWQQCFGKGIVATSYDFGNQGSLPTHPRLLDHLAIKLKDNGWDIKAILKYIVLSATYRQSARTTPELMERDPENQLLARAPRLRLTAEQIRDHALSISGLLVKEIGGPSVKPYQPEGLWAEKIGGGGGSTAKYVPDEGKKLYRRSLYTFWKRTVPPPSMMTFDAVSRDFCMVKRETTSTPLQALVMLNDPQIVEAARVLSYRAIEEKSELQERIAFMFQLATSRTPEKEELAGLTDYFKEELNRFSNDETAAEAFLNIGQYAQKALLGKAEMAAYALVANTIFNLDETITRG
ncbi:MAG: PSD1 and planctomycete cytochrome C domain-containing protein [Bacteroidota bacterium]